MAGSGSAGAGGGSPLATEFVEFKASGDVDVHLEKIREQLEAADKSLGTAAGGFRTFFMEKTGLSKRLLEAQAQLARQESALYDTGPYQRYVRAHVALTDQLTANRQKAAVKQAQATVQYHASPEGQQALKGQAEANRQLEQLARQDAWQKMVAQQGLVTASLGRMTDRLRAFQGASALAFGTATGGVLGFVAAASPAHMDTFTGSIGLVSTAIGQAFLPYIEMAIDYLQDLAFWIHDLDPATKDSIASWVMWGGAIGGVVLLLPRVIGIGAGLLAVLRAANAATVALAVGTANASGGITAAGVAARLGAVSFATLGTSIRAAGAAMTAFALANPLTVVLVLAAAVYALSQAFAAAGEGVGQISARLEQMEDLLDRIRGGGGVDRRTAERVLSPEVYQQLQGARGNPQQQQQILAQALPGARAEAAQQRGSEDRANRLRAQLEGQMQREQGQNFAERFADSSEIGQRMREERTRRRLQTAGVRPENMPSAAELHERLTPERINQLVGTVRGQGNQAQARVELMERLRRNPEELANVTGNRPRLTQHNFQAQIMATEQAWRRVQTAAAGLSPLEQQRQQWQNDVRDRLGQIADNTRRPGEQAAPDANTPRPPPPRG